MTRSPTRTPFFSKRTMTWAGVAGVAGCAACCGLPLLALAGVGGGTLATIASLFKPGMELAVGAGLFAATLGIAAIATRKRACTATPASGAACDVDGACGCAPRSTVFRSPQPSADAPVACTANLSQIDAIQQHMDAYRDAFRSLKATEPFSGGFRWRFDARPGLEPLLREIAEREHQCCSFFAFHITSEGSDLVWEVRADAKARQVLDDFSRLPAHLAEEPRAGHDLVHLKRRFDEIGLRFTHDVTPAGAPASRLPGSPSFPLAR